MLYDWIASQQEKRLRPHMTTIIDLIQLSEFGEVDQEITFSFVPLWALDEKGEAELKELEARTDMAYIDGGVLHPEEVRESVASDPDSRYASIDVQDVPDLKQEEMAGLDPGAGGGQKGIGKPPQMPDGEGGEPGGGGSGGGPETGGGQEEDMDLGGDPEEIEENLTPFEQRVRAREERALTRLDPDHLLKRRENKRQLAEQALRAEEDNRPYKERVAARAERHVRGEGPFYDRARTRARTGEGRLNPDYLRNRRLGHDSPFVVGNDWEETKHSRGEGGKFIKGGPGTGVDPGNEDHRNRLPPEMQQFHEGMGKVAQKYGFKQIGMSSDPAQVHKMWKRPETGLKNPFGGERLHFYPKHDNGTNLCEHRNLKGERHLGNGGPEEVEAFLKNKGADDQDINWGSEEPFADFVPTKDEAQFEESKHPRDKGGKFATSPGGGEGGSAEPKTKAGQKKKHMIGEMLAKGTTPKEILAATGWKAVSMPAAAKALGVELEKYKENGVTKYKSVQQKLGGEPKAPPKQKLEDWEKGAAAKELNEMIDLSGMGYLYSISDVKDAKAHSDKFKSVVNKYGLSDQDVLDLVGHGAETSTKMPNKTPLAELTNSQHVIAVASIQQNFGTQLGEVKTLEDVANAKKHNPDFASTVSWYDLSDEDALILVKEAQEQAMVEPAGPKSLKLEDLIKTGSAKGSNPGGIYIDEDGKKYYVKLTDEAHAQNEILAGQLYELTGAKTKKYVPLEGGKGIASEFIKLDKDNAKNFTAAERKEAQLDFATHAWLANWDAAGLNDDNQVIANGKPMTVDVGGALEYRAQGTPKGVAFGDKVTEWDSMRNPDVNKENAKLFGDMTPEQLKESVDRVSKVTDDQIWNAVNAMVGKDNNAKIALTAKLQKRRNDLVNRANVEFEAKGGKPAVPPPPPVPVKTVPNPIGHLDYDQAGV